MDIKLILILNTIAIVAIFISNFFIPKDKVRSYTTNKIAVMIAIDILLLLL